jgi:hypothetical protein
MGRGVAIRVKLGGNMKTFQAAVITFVSFLVPRLQTQQKSPRDYFDELKSAGAFVSTLTTVDGEKISSPDPGYVCFAENPAADSTGLFLIFHAIAYDKNYNEASAILTADAKLNDVGHLEEMKKAKARLDDIQNRQPYVLFLPDDLISALPVEVADFLRKGGEELDLGVYWHGVKSQTVSYHRFKETDEWKSENGKADFAIEPSTMRFLW